MTERNDAWPHLGSVLKGIAAVIVAMVCFAVAVLVPYLHTTRADSRPRLAMAHVTAPDPAEARDESDNTPDGAASVQNHHYKEAHRLNASN